MSSTLLHRINPEKNEARFYLVTTGPTLFEKHAVTRWWGRIDGWQQEMITPCESDEAAEAFAKALGIKAQVKREPKREGLGLGGCRPCCPHWTYCCRHMGREAVPCEVLSFWDEDPALVDLEPVYGGRVALGTRLYVIEDEL